MTHPSSLLDHLDPIGTDWDAEYNVVRVRQFVALAKEALDELAVGRRSPLAVDLGLYRDIEHNGTCHLMAMLLSLYVDLRANPEGFDPYDQAMLRSAVGCSPVFAARVQERIGGLRFAAFFEASASASCVA